MPLTPPTPEILIDKEKVKQIQLHLNGMAYDVALEHLIFTIMEVIAVMPNTKDGKRLQIERDGLDSGAFHRNINVRVQTDRP